MKNLTTREFREGFPNEEEPAEYQPPIVKELEAILWELPDDDLIAALKGPIRRGPKGYPPELLWRCFVSCTT